MSHGRWMCTLYGLFHDKSLLKGHTRVAVPNMELGELLALPVISSGSLDSVSVDVYSGGETACWFQNNTLPSYSEPL